MTPKLILTLAQARMLQRLSKQNVSWPHAYTVIAETPVPSKEDNLLDGDRETAGLAALDLGWTDEQIAIQLNCKPTSQALKNLRKLHYRLNAK